MATVSLYLDKRACSEGQNAPIKIAINHKGATTLISTGIKVSENQWDGRRKEVVSHPNKRQINMFLSGRKLQIESVILSLTGLERRTAREIREMILDEIDPERSEKKERQNSFLNRMRHYASLARTDSTRYVYERTLRRLKEFDPQAESLAFSDIDKDYLRRFEAFCARTEKKNTRNIHLRNIRAIFNDAIDAEITTCYPFRKFSIKPEQVAKKSLTKSELRRLLEVQCEDYQKEYRDMFLLMIMLRGINACDLFSATDRDVVHGRLEYRRRKVGTLFSVKLEPEAMEIINRYKGKNYLLIPLDRYKYYADYLHHFNDALKQIGRPLQKPGQRLSKRNSIIGPGLFPGLSSNWARHTWATIASELDIPKDIISRGLGHSFGVAVTDIYIDFDMKKVDDANRRIIDYLFLQ